MPDESPIGILPMIPNRLLRCPHSGRGLLPASTEVLARLEAAIAAGTAFDAAGNRVREGWSAALTDTSGEWLYPLDGPTPRMLPEEAIRLPPSHARLPPVETRVPAKADGGNFPREGNAGSPGDL